jgi:hypothetical protein
VIRRINPDDVCAVLSMIRWLDQRYINGTLTVDDWRVNGPGVIAPNLDRLAAMTHFGDWMGDVTR